MHTSLQTCKSITYPQRYGKENCKSPEENTVQSSSPCFPQSLLHLHTEVCTGRSCAEGCFSIWSKTSVATELAAFTLAQRRFKKNSPPTIKVHFLSLFFYHSCEIQIIEHRNILLRLSLNFLNFIVKLKKNNAMFTNY